jgi:hypothetical protein
MDGPLGMVGCVVVTEVIDVGMKRETQSVVEPM